ncbi:MAG: hypothetical protein ABW223_09000 [Rariglobus sp.]
MSPLARYSLIALTAAALAFGVTHFALKSTADTTAHADELGWLKKEFDLTAAQTAAVEKLHADYQPICAAHCERVVAAREKLANATDPDAARTELARLEAVCRDATHAHLQQVAAVMSPDEGARFLALVGPKVSGQTHAAPLGLK